MAGLGVASDGLRARVNGPWARRKLEFLTQFGPPALDATVRKRRRIYLDLFAGPGINLTEPQGGEEFPSGALRMLALHGHHAQHPAFTSAYLVNGDPGGRPGARNRLPIRHAGGERSGLCPVRDK